MLAIIISACLVADPGTCKDYRVSVDQDVEPSKCALWAPPHFAQWAEEHPGWRITKWHCTNKSAKDI
jgi:hypothetical protein